MWIELNRGVYSLTGQPDGGEGLAIMQGLSPRGPIGQSNHALPTPVHPGLR